MPKKSMPAERESVTHKIRIRNEGGDLEGYITVGLYPDGMPGEVFLTVQQGGSMERGLCHALALMISLALQHGVPLKEITDKLTGLQFEPRGLTGSKTIPMTSSVADYIGRWLRERFLKEENDRSTN